MITEENDIVTADGSLSSDDDKPLIISIDESVLTIAPGQNSESVPFVETNGVPSRTIPSKYNKKNCLLHKAERDSHASSC